MDIWVEDLLAAFHVVIVATGLGSDKRLDIPQDPAARVIGASALIRLLDSDPESVLRGSVSEAIGDDVVVVGTGNVAVDVARLLVKSDPDFTASDVNDVALRAIAPRPIKHISILGRCEAQRAKWDQSMLKELAEVVGVQLRVDGQPLLSEEVAPDVRTTVDVWFQQVPVAIRDQDGRVEVTTKNASDPAFVNTVLADSVITALGCDSTQANRQTFGALESHRIFRVGGPATGRLGNLAENRKLAAGVAKEVADLLASLGPERRAGIAALEHLLPGVTVSFADWQRIDAAEILRARTDRCRAKFTTKAELLAAATDVPHALSMATHAATSIQEN